MTDDGVDAAIADIENAREDVIEAVVRFARALRRTGVTVPADGPIVAAESLAEIGLSDEARVRAATKAAFLSRETDVAAFEELFDRFWRELRAAGDEPPEIVEEIADDANPILGGTPGEDGETDPAEGDDGGGDGEEYATGSATASALSGSGLDLDGETVEIARYSPGGNSETVERTGGTDRYRRGLAEHVGRLTGALATLPGRRRRRTRNGRFVDARSALRTSFQTGGVVASLPETERADSAVQGVVLVDVSQSVLDSVDREFLLEWLRLLYAEWRSLRVFFFDTELREVTDAFEERSVLGVSEALASAEAAWGGGTRIGEAFRTVRRSHPGAVDHRTVVLVVSDGLERGEVDELERSAAWLSRRARLLLWLNPLAASPAYEPTARGMAAALPAVDGLFAFAGVDDVAELARQLDRHDRTRLGYEYDPRRGDVGRDGDDRDDADGRGAAGPDADGDSRTDSTMETVTDTT